MPISLLSRMGAIEKAVQAVAKRLFFDSHELRERVPPNFDRSFELRLKDFESSSADNLIMFEAPAVPAAFVELVEELQEEASAKVLSGMRSLEQQERTLPREAYRHLAILGKMIEGEETLTVFVSADQEAVRGPNDADESWTITRARAAALERAAEPGESTDRPFAIVGRVVESSDVKQTFLIQEHEAGSKHLFRFEPSVREIVSRCHYENERFLVRVTGTQREDDEGNLVDTRKANFVQVVSGPAIGQQLRHLTDLQPGWLDGDGEVPTRRTLVAAADLAWYMIEHVGVDRPYLFPTPHGSVNLEWDRIMVDVVASADGSATYSGVCPLLPDGDDLAESGDAAKVREWMERAVAAVTGNSNE